MKKYLLTGGFAAMLLLGACGTEEVEAEKEEATTEEIESTEEETNEEVVEKEETAENEAVPGAGINEPEGEEEVVIENEKTIEESISISKGNLNITLLDGGAGDMTVDEEMSWYFEDVAVGETVATVVLEFEVENTVEESRDFYLDQTSIVTNTGEQVESEWMMESGLQSEMLGAVTSTGVVTFLLNAETIEGIEWVDVIIPAVSDENWNTLAEEEKMRVHFK